MHAVLAVLLFNELLIRPHTIDLYFVENAILPRDTRTIPTLYVLFSSYLFVIVTYIKFNSVHRSNGTNGNTT